MSALADFEGWTFYAYSSTNVSDGAAASEEEEEEEEEAAAAAAQSRQQFKMYTNLWERVDNVHFRTCLQNPSAFFTGIEVAYTTYIA